MQNPAMAHSYLGRAIHFLISYISKYNINCKIIGATSVNLKSFLSSTDKEVYSLTFLTFKTTSSTHVNM